MADYNKALRCLNKLNNYSKLPEDHRWVSTIRHYIKDKNFSSCNTAMLEIALVLRECIDDCFSSYGHPLRDNKDTKKRLNAVIAQLRAGANEN